MALVLSMPFKSSEDETFYYTIFIKQSNLLKKEKKLKRVNTVKRIASEQENVHKIIIQK